MNYVYDCLSLSNQDDISITRLNNHIVIVIQTYGINEVTKAEVDMKGIDYITL